MGSGCIYPHFLDLGTSWRWVVSFTVLPLYPRYALDRWTASRSGRSGKKKILDSTGTRTPTPRSSSPWPVAIPTTTSRILDKDRKTDNVQKNNICNNSRVGHPLLQVSLGLQHIWTAGYNAHNTTTPLQSKWGSLYVALIVRPTGPMQWELDQTKGDNSTPLHESLWTHTRDLRSLEHVGMELTGGVCSHR
jgi:hypothetical protein